MVSIRNQILTVGTTVIEDQINSLDAKVIHLTHLGPRI